MQIELKPYDYLFKIILLGESGVGKTSLMSRYMDGGLVDGISCSFGIDFRMKTIDINGKKAKIQLWDTAGQERFNTIMASYYRGAAVIFFLFDVSDRSSMERINYWYEESIKHGSATTIRILVGCKCDLFKDRVVTYKEAQQFSASLSMVYLETSAKQNIGIDQIFSLGCTLAMQIADGKGPRDPKDIVIKQQTKKSWMQRNFQCC